MTCVCMPWKTLTPSMPNDKSLWANSYWWKFSTTKSILSIIVFQCINSCNLCKPLWCEHDRKNLEILYAKDMNRCPILVINWTYMTLICIRMPSQPPWSFVKQKNSCTFPSANHLSYQCLFGVFFAHLKIFLKPSQSILNLSLRI